MTADVQSAKPHRSIRRECVREFSRDSLPYRPVTYVRHCSEVIELERAMARTHHDRGERAVS